MPGTAVAIDLYSPPRFGSNVCAWLGPPSIHNRMHDFGFLTWRAASLANALNQGTRGAASKPAAEILRRSRRDIGRCGILMGGIPCLESRVSGRFDSNQRTSR